MGFGTALISMIVSFVIVLTVMSAASKVEQEYYPLETTVLYSSDGKVLAGFYEEDRVHIVIDEVPEKVKNAFIAVEDQNFYNHPGIDFWGILRAFYVNIRYRSIVEGAAQSPSNWPEIFTLLTFVH